MAQATPVVNVCGPWLGMRRVWRAPRDPQRVYEAVNMLPQVRGIPSPYVSMFWPARTTGPAGVAVQNLNVFVGPVGAPPNVLIAGGQIYRDNGASWVVVISTANLTAAAITLATTGRVFTVVFGAYLIVTDGVNTPFAWDGTQNGGLTKLTNAPVFYGRPTVYYGKIVGIKSTDRKTIVWSEENQPNSGYEAGGFNNAWSLTQTGGGDLYALQGTNEALYYFRADRCGAIRGAVTTDFTASGTHDDVGAVGTTDPEAVAAWGSRVWFADRDGRPHVIEGARAHPVWAPIADFFATLAGDYAPIAAAAPGVVVVVPQENLVFLSWPSRGFLVFDAETAEPLCFYFPPGGALSDGGVALICGPQVTNDKRQLGMAYRSDVGANPRVDRWPPYDAADGYVWADSAVVRDALTVGPLGVAPLTTDWLTADLYTYVARDSAVGPGPALAVYANNEEAYDPGPLGYGVADNMTAVGAAQTALVSVDQRRNRILSWGLKRSVRQLWLAIAQSGGSSPAAWGVDQLIAQGQAFPTTPSKS